MGSATCQRWQRRRKARLNVASACTDSNKGHRFFLGIACSRALTADRRPGGHPSAARSLRRGLCRGGRRSRRLIGSSTHLYARFKIGDQAAQNIRDLVRFDMEAEVAMSVFDEEIAWCKERRAVAMGDLTEFCRRASNQRQPGY